MNREQLLALVTTELKIPLKQVENVISLLDEGNTVPFIARYRKEMTGGLDEVQIKNIMETWQYNENLANRKEEVLRLIDEQGKLTSELKQNIEKARKLQEVEDLYRPYKQKRRTKATIAKEKGLEPLATWLMSLPQEGNVEQEAEKYISEEHEVNSAEEALEGANDIIAESISDDPEIRKWIRKHTHDKGLITSTVKEKERENDEKKIYEMYYEYSEACAKIVPHRILALNRGEKDGILKVSVEPPTDSIITYMIKVVLKGKQTIAESYVIHAIEDSFKRLINPSIEREIRKELTEVAEEQAIHIFSENLRNLLLQPPLKGNVVLAVDPAYRTGCKLAVVDETGKVLSIDVIYPHKPKNQYELSQKKIIDTVKKYGVKVIAVGNGTASRETEQLIAETIKMIDAEIFYLIVNEAGASVYSASDIAREEFPNLQVEERSAVSIGRRLQDPLAELVKIDPKSVGVGQYQHDVSQKKLDDSLTFVVETVVNRVGVNVNTASPSLLQYVSGLSKAVAKNIVMAREEKGKFTNRKELKKIPRLGAKTYEQCIGFLRIIDGDQPLDYTGIHPESYDTAIALLKELDLTVNDLGTEALREKVTTISIEDYAERLGVGKPTLKDIIEAIIRPGRDPRDEVPKPLLKSDILKLEDLKQGMELEGTVRNVVDFGAFIDVGLKQDGLVHISKMSKQFVKHPMNLVSVGDVVQVWVDSVDVQKERVALTMVSPN